MKLNNSERFHRFLFERNWYITGLETIVRAREIALLAEEDNFSLLSDLWRLEGRLSNENNQPRRAMQCFANAKESADRAIDAGQMDPKDTRMIRILTGWGNCLNQLDRYDEAYSLQTEALKLAEEAPEKHGDAVVIVKLNLGYVLYRKGTVECAERMFHDALCLDRKSQPIMYALGNIELAYGNLAEALELHSQALNLYVDQFGRQHHMVADSAYKVGEVYFRKGELDLAA